MADAFACQRPPTNDDPGWEVGSDDLYGIGTIFFSGILLGMARIATGSLLTPLAMHAVNNLISMVQTALSV